MMLKKVTVKIKLRQRKCKWCGKLFTFFVCRQNNARKYCSEEHTRFAYLDAHREANARYEKRYAFLFNEEWSGDRLGRTYLREHRAKNFKSEERQIKKELRRIGL